MNGKGVSHRGSRFLWVRDHRKMYFNTWSRVPPFSGSCVVCVGGGGALCVNKIFLNHSCLNTVCFIDCSNRFIFLHFSGTIRFSTTHPHRLLNSLYLLLFSLVKIGSELRFSVQNCPAQVHRRETYRCTSPVGSPLWVQIQQGRPDFESQAMILELWSRPDCLMETKNAAR
jgi:hypothetical protein